MNQQQKIILRPVLKELQGQCNRYTNGVCQTAACLKRGGYIRGETPNYDVATCERYVQAQTLEVLLND